MGHFWVIVRLITLSSGFISVTIVSLIVYSPSGTTVSTIPSTSGGTMTLWVIAGVSGTSAMIVPPSTRSPGFTHSFVCHFLWVSSESMENPRSMYLPDFFSISASGRSMPSKILETMPGASVTDRVAPVGYKSSPGFKPDVSSNT